MRSNASPILDAVGNLYGTTAGGGAYNAGTVYELSPQAGGHGFVETRLHDFGKGTDGGNPWASVVFDSAGNLYGTTGSGGTKGGGTVFELNRDAGGKWTEKILYNFISAGTSFFPSGLILDAAGNLYGTTNESGAFGSGMVYKLSPTASGNWTATILHSFNSNGVDGTYPVAGVISDAAGNLYGTTWFGGTFGLGTVFKLTKTAEGWPETILHSFSGGDGSTPADKLVQDAAGNLFGTTRLGGGNDMGVIFELTPHTGGVWTEKVLHSFVTDGEDGLMPFGNLVFDSTGNLYGTTSAGGVNRSGTVFKLTPAAGSWTETVLYSFRRDSSDAMYPYYGLSIDAAGILYGTTTDGGLYNGGTLYAITP